MFKDSPEGQTQYEPAALVGIEPAGYVISSETAYLKMYLPMNSNVYSAATVVRLNRQLAASQAREQQLREGLTKVAIAWSSNGRYDFLLVNGILESTSTDDTALRQWGAKLLRNMADECHYDRDGEMLCRKADELEEG